MTCREGKWARRKGEPGWQDVGIMAEREGQGAGQGIGGTPVGGKIEIGGGRVDDREISGKGSLGNFQPQSSDSDTSRELAKEGAP